MNAVTAVAVAVIFGAGIHLMSRADVVRVVAGTLLISNAAVLLLVSAGFGDKEAPLLPVNNLFQVADPLVQALALTAVVITFATTVLLLRVVLTVERTHDSLLIRDLLSAEVAHEDKRGETPE